MSPEEVLLKSAVIDDGPGRSRVSYYGDISTHRQPTPADMTAAKEIFRVLKREFPGHPWSVEVDAKEGWAKIGILQLLGPNWTMFMKFEDWTDQKVRDLAGQLLERFKIPRSTIDIAAYMSADSKIPLLGCFRAKDRHRIPT